MDWSWRWIIAPPGHFWDNPVYDVVRLGVVLGCIVLTGLCFRIVREQNRRADLMSRGQRSRFVSLALACVFVGFTELAVFGTPATPRLGVSVAMVAYGLHGAHRQRQEQRATPVVRG